MHRRCSRSNCGGIIAIVIKRPPTYSEGRDGEEQLIHESKSNPEIFTGKCRKTFRWKQNNRSKSPLGISRDVTLFSLQFPQLFINAHAQNPQSMLPMAFPVISLQFTRLFSTLRATNQDASLGQFVFHFLVKLTIAFSLCDEGVK